MIDDAMELTFCGSSDAKQRLEAADQRVEIQCRLGPRQWNESAWRQGPFSVLTRSTIDLEVSIADQILVADWRGRRLVQLHGAVDRKFDPDPLVPVDQVHLFDLADFHAGRADELPRP